MAPNEINSAEAKWLPNAPSPVLITANIQPVRIGHWGNGDYRVEITSHTDLDYVMTLVRQSYEMNR